ncbi:MAG TPA: TRAP transporter substrate-binding protein [Acidimicrobiia bacterium]|nr:TRAP transporter substrate-binding protein [Acidimicrobiia bacterium]
MSERGPRRRSSTLVPILMVLAMVVVACGGDGTTETTETTGTTAAPAETTTTAPEETTTTGPAPIEEPVILRLSVETNVGDPLANLLTYFGDNLESELGDRIAVERFLGGALGDEIAQMELIRAGEVDVVPIGSDIVQLDSSFGIFDFPFLFPDRETVYRLLDGDVGQQLKDSLLESAGLVVLGFGENGFRQITNNVRPVVTPADLDGLKLRTPGSETRILAFTSLGAVPTPMDLGEVYLALDQGVLDGQENPMGVVQEFSFYEVQAYLSLSNHVYSPITLAINADTWDSLPDDVKTAVENAAAAAVAQSREEGQANDQNLAAELEAEGMEVNEIDIAAFQEAATPIWEELASVVGEEFAAAVIAEVTG